MLYFFTGKGSERIGLIAKQNLLTLPPLECIFPELSDERQSYAFMVGNNFLSTLV